MGLSAMHCYNIIFQLLLLIYQRIIILFRYDRYCYYGEQKNIHRIVNYLISKGAERFAFVGDIYSANVGRGFQERFDALQECLSDNHLELDRKHCLLTETSDEFQDFQTVVKNYKRWLLFRMYLFVGMTIQQSN